MFYPANTVNSSLRRRNLENLLDGGGGGLIGEGLKRSGSFRRLRKLVLIKTSISPGESIYSFSFLPILYIINSLCYY